MLNLPDSQIIDQYTHQHIGMPRLSRIYGVSQTAIRDRLIKNGVALKPRCHKILIDKEELDELYSKQHLASTEIARRYNITFTTVLRLLRHYNIPIRPNHDQTYNRNRINIRDFPIPIKESRYNGNRLEGLITCPICRKDRWRSLFGKDNKTANAEFNGGICRYCSIEHRTTEVNISQLKRLYYDRKLKLPEIAEYFHLSVRNIRAKMKLYNLQTRRKGEIRVLRINNKGTLEKPELGDIQRGTSIGINDKSYYLYTACSKCQTKRWQLKSRAKTDPYCFLCAAKINGLNHRLEKAPGWLGGKSFEPYTFEFDHERKELIRARDNYICQICLAPQNGKRLAIHHIDYDKKNCDHRNLISLCPTCHSKTNHKRIYWQYFLTAKMLTKYALPMLCS